MKWELHWICGLSHDGHLMDFGIAEQVAAETDPRLAGPHPATEIMFGPVPWCPEHGVYARVEPTLVEDAPPTGQKCWCGEVIDPDNCVIVVEDGKRTLFHSGECYR